MRTVRRAAVCFAFGALVGCVPAGLALRGATGGADPRNPTEPNSGAHGAIPGSPGAVPGAHGAIPGSPGAVPGSPDAPAVIAETGAGEVRVAVRWPDTPRFSAQTIPLSAVAVDIDILASGSTPIATGSIVRPATSASLKGVPSGTYVLHVLARRAGAARTVVADGTRSIQVVTNRLSSANLALRPKFRPRLDYVYPDSGEPGSTLTLYGDGLAPPPGGTYSVLVDGLPVPDADLQSGNSFIVISALPSWAGAVASISVSVDGVAAPPEQTVTFSLLSIDHISISPTAATMSAAATASFTAKAWRDASESEEVPNVGFTWSLLDKVPADDLSSNFIPIFFLADGLLGTRVTTGSVTIEATGKGKTATASVVVKLDPAVDPLD